MDKHEIKQKHAVEAWREVSGNISKLCMKVGISRKTFYEWLKEPGFAEQISDAEASLNDDIQSALIKRALYGNLRAVTYWLSHKHPNFNGETKITVDPKIGGEMNITFTRGD